MAGVAFSFRPGPREEVSIPPASSFSTRYRAILKANKLALRNGLIIATACIGPHRRWVLAEGVAASHRGSINTIKRPMPLL
jgi:hypothetical protein